MASWKAGIVVWFYVGTILGLSLLAGGCAWRRQQPALVWVSGLLFPVAGAFAWFLGGLGGLDGLLAVLAFCLAVASTIWTLIERAAFGDLPHDPRRSTLAFAHAAVQASIVLLGLTVVRGLAQVLLGISPVTLHPLNWLALAATGVALISGLWDPKARFSAAGLYACSLITVGMAQLQRGFFPARFLLWGAACDLAGFVLVAALFGWGLTRLQREDARRSGRWSAKLRLPSSAGRWSAQWFRGVQVLMALTVAGLTVGIAADARFDGLGQGVALFGLGGRSAACPAALMLLGTAILMAWQNTGVWRAGWQYAALLAGILFTTSVGWAMMAPATASPWLYRGGSLLISASMMTLMTGFGLRRFLPRHSDWIARGRRAMPAFAVLALVLLVLLASYRGCSS